MSEEPEAAAPGGDGTARASSPPTADVVRAQLTRILTSQIFAQAPMLRRFLQYLVERTLAGDQEIKEYVVGVEVFDRGSDFDPRTDTIVRAQARRLRAKLDEYYRQEGAKDSILIDVPKGRYLVECRARPVPGDRATRPEPVPEAQPSIVVLPFVNLNADPETEFLTDGLTEELIGTLASVAEMRVVARTSAFHFKGRTEDIRRIGQRLGVRTALEGSVRIHQQRMRVVAQLIDLASGLHLWAETYDRTLGAVFEIQQDIARAIVDNLRIRLAPGDRTRLRSAPPQNTDAYDLYLKSRYCFFKFTPADIRKSVEHMERAVALAPTFAAAHAGLAESYVSWAGMQTEAPLPYLVLARAAAERALALEASAEAHAAMGAVLALGDFNWRESEREFRRALDLKPSYTIGRGWYATACLCPVRRYADAIDELQECLSVDPLSVLMRVMLGQTLILAADFDAAVREVRHALALEPDSTFGYVTLGLAQLGAGSYREARETLLHVEPSARDFPNFWGHLGFAHAKLGQREEAHRALRELQERFAPWVPYVDAAAVHNGLGDTTRALDCLDGARRDRSFDWLFIADDPRLVNLKSNPRFVKLLPPTP